MQRNPNPVDVRELFKGIFTRPALWLIPLILVSGVVIHSLTAPKKFSCSAQIMVGQTMETNKLRTEVKRLAELAEVRNILLFYQKGNTASKDTALIGVRTHDNTYGLAEVDVKSIASPAACKAYLDQLLKILQETYDEKYKAMIQPDMDLLEYTNRQITSAEAEMRKIEATPLRSELSSVVGELRKQELNKSLRQDTLLKNQLEKLVSPGVSYNFKFLQTHTNDSPDPTGLVSRVFSALLIGILFSGLLALILQYRKLVQS